MTGYGCSPARWWGMMRFPILLLGCGLAAACGQSGPVANGAENTSTMAAPDEAEIDPSAGAPANATASNRPAGATPVLAATKIPALYHGRWGMTPQDCTSTRGDNKGLLTISADELRFYESRAIPGDDLSVEAASIRGNFAFTGEGQEWSKFQTLRVEGTKLTRSESDPAASYTYAKCS